jgi:heat shock protein HtpX
MWEAIRDNTRRSRLLIGLMGALLVGLGFVIGLAWLGPDGGIPGAAGALVLWLIMLVAALSGGEQLVLMSARARQIKKEDAPRLWNVVEEMTIASGLGKMPKIYIIDNDMPNAFATGRKLDVACVAVTSGLLRRLNRDELQGVIAHEIGHIKNLDVRFMTIAAVMLGSIVILADLFFRVMWFGGGGRRRGGGSSGQAQLIFLAVAVLAAILAPLFAQMLYFACSRRREYLADASAARYTRYPEGLASALEKISGHVTRSRKKKDVQRALAPMYIVNPLQAASGKLGLFSTHPSTQKRVEILRAMGGMAGWVDYDRAYRKVTGKGSGIDAKALGEEQSIAARESAADPDARKDAVERGREVADFLDRMVSFLVVACPCGLRIKIPPELKRDHVACPRCGRDHPVPQAEAAQAAAETAKRVASTKAAGAAAAGAAVAAAAPLSFTRRGTGWESFKCACGNVLQISPAFRQDHMTCNKCRRKIAILGS